MPIVVKPSLERAWPVAADRVSRWLERRERVDGLFEGLPAGLSGPERARCQHLLFGVIRHAGRIESALDRLIAHPPRFITRAVLFLAGFELLEGLGAAADPGLPARIVHHAVDRTKELASPAEAGLVNAVGRKLSEMLSAQAEPGRLASAAVLAEYYSHPEWMVRRWLATFGAEATRRLLVWNQTPHSLFLRWRGAPGAAPEWLKATDWGGFFGAPPGRHSEVEALVREGLAYIQDPGTRFAVELLAPQPGELVLDLCAAPGGKSVLIADSMGTGRLVAFDLPGERLVRLKENLSRIRGVEAVLVPGDIVRGAAGNLEARGFPDAFSAVLIDVPCSNTGVMRHRVDVKWRLLESDLVRHPRQQLALLSAASRLVAPGGRIVYSTCSIDPAENEQVVADFVKHTPAFELEARAVALPWEAGHDGVGAFRLRRTAAAATGPDRRP